MPPDFRFSKAPAPDFPFSKGGGSGFPFSKAAPAALGRLLAQLEARDSLGHWHWARALLEAWQAGRPETGQPWTELELGEEVGLAAGRKGGYSGSWVSKVLSAARAWPNPPRTDGERHAFVQAYHGKKQTAVVAPHSPPPPAVARRRVAGRLFRAAVEWRTLGQRRAELHGLVDAGFGSAGPAPAVTRAAAALADADPAAWEGRP